MAQCPVCHLEYWSSRTRAAYRITKPHCQCEELKPLDKTYQRDSLTSQALGLSAGTLATLTGLRTYTELDVIQAAFVHFCDRADGQHTTCWQDAWQRFWPLYTCPTGPQTLDELAHTLTQASARTQAQLDREGIEAERKTKLRPRKVQAEPVGLFEQVQGQLL
jgi:hypothetical protein